MNTTRVWNAKEGRFDIHIEFKSKQEMDGFNRTIEEMRRSMEYMDLGNVESGKEAGTGVSDNIVGMESHDPHKIGEYVPGGLSRFVCSRCGALCEMSVNGRDVKIPDRCPYGQTCASWEVID